MLDWDFGVWHSSSSKHSPFPGSESGNFITELRVIRVAVGGDVFKGVTGMNSS